MQARFSATRYYIEAHTAADCDDQREGRNPQEGRHAGIEVERGAAAIDRRRTSGAAGSPGADHLTARRLRVQDAPERAASIRRTRVSPVAASTPIRENARQRSIAVCPIEVAEHQPVLRNACPPITSQPRQAARCAPPNGPAVREHRVGGGEAELLRHRLAQLDARGIDPSGRIVATPLPAGTADAEKVESPRRTTTRSSGTPIISAAVWAMMV